MPIGPWELLIIAFLIVLLFGAKRLPEMGRSLGTGMREFKQAIGFSGSDDESERRALEASAADDDRDARERAAGARVSR